MRTILANAGHIGEFATDPKSGLWLTGTCGETALAVAIGICRGDIATQAAMLAIYDDMRARGLITNVNGASTMAEGAAEARAAGMTIVAEHDYQGDNFPGVDWVSIIRATAGRQPIVLQLANGQALGDIVTGVHDESGVKYHFICIVGVQDGQNGNVPAAYVVADGDNRGVSDGFQLYSMGVLQAALPCAMLILAMPTTTTGGSSMSTPAPGWSDNGTTLTGPAAPDGTRYPVVGGMRDQMLSMLHAGTMAPDDMPLQAEHANGTNRIEQYTNYHLFVFARANANSAWSFFLSNLGATVLAQNATIAGLNAQLTAANTSAQQAETTIATLHATIATLQSQLSGEPAANPSPNPTPISAEDQKKIDVMNQFIALAKGA